MVTPDPINDTLRYRLLVSPLELSELAKMDRAVRIAVVGPVDNHLVDDLRGLPLSPEVRGFQSVHGDTEALSGFEPDLLVASVADTQAEDIGALRLLRNLWNHLGIILVTDIAGEIEAVPVAARIGARVLIYPDKPGLLAATVEQALLGGDRPRADVFLDLAHGMADEINNPLLFVSGHLQLLHAGLDPTTDRGRRDQVRSVLDGVNRIQVTLDRLRLLSQAANGPRSRQPVDLAELLRTALATRSGTEDAKAAVTIGEGDLAVPGDADQLGSAIGEIVRFADAMTEAGTAGEMVLETLDAAVRLQVVLRGDALAQWRLPHTFEPFYPSRMLRGHGHGLALFLAQTIVLGHGGQATARRLVNGSLQIDFVLRR